MRWVAATVALTLLAAYPLGLSAQVVYPSPNADDNGATQATYQQPAGTPIKLAAPPEHSDTNKTSGGFAPLMTVGGSLALVLGIFLLVVWFMRRVSPASAALLPTEAFEMLGRAPLANHQQVHLLRCGNKLLLVAVSGGATGSAAKTLTEITDPAEVDRLADLCRRARPSGTTASFRQIFRQVEQQHA